MFKFQPRIKLALAVLGLWFSSSPLWANEAATAGEILLLPRYCWAEHNPKLKNRPGFDYNLFGCGVGMNHYCWAMLHLARADKMPHNQYKLGELNAVQREIRYTLGWIERNGTFNCALKKDADRMDAILTEKIKTEQRYQASRVP